MAQPQAVVPDGEEEEGEKDGHEVKDVEVDLCLGEGVNGGRQGWRGCSRTLHLPSARVTKTEPNPELHCFPRDRI